MRHFTVRIKHIAIKQKRANEQRNLKRFIHARTHIHSCAHFLLTIFDRGVQHFQQCWRRRRVPWEQRHRQVGGENCYARRRNRKRKRVRERSERKRCCDTVGTVCVPLDSYMQTRFCREQRFLFS